MEKHIADGAGVRIQERPLKAFIGGLLFFGFVGLFCLRFNRWIIVAGCFAAALAAGAWAMLNRSTLVFLEDALEIARPAAGSTRYAWRHIHAVNVIPATDRSRAGLSFRYDARLPGQLSEPLAPTMIELNDTYPVNLDAIAGAIIRRRSAWMEAHPLFPETPAPEAESA